MDDFEKIIEMELAGDYKNHVSMNFKVSFEFRQAIKIYAARNSISMHDLFVFGFRHQLNCKNIEDKK